MHQCLQHSYRGYGPCAACVDIFGRDVVYERRVKSREEIGEEIRRKRQEEAAEKKSGYLEKKGDRYRQHFLASRELKRRAAVTCSRERREEIMEEWRREQERWLEELGQASTSI